MRRRTIHQVQGLDGEARPLVELVGKDKRRMPVRSFEIAGVDHGVILAMADLPKAMRTLLRWRFGLGREALSYHQIAERLGCPVEDVRDAEAAALAAMRESA